MKEKYFINARIIDPSQGIDEIGGLIVDANGKITDLGMKNTFSDDFFDPYTETFNTASHNMISDGLMAEDDNAHNDDPGGVNPSDPNSSDLSMF